MSTYAGGSETTIYVGGVLEKLTTATRTHWKHLIVTPSGEVQVIRRSDGTTHTFYLTTDHLGSTDAVLNAAGTVLMQSSFGVHGARRASNWLGAPSSTECQAIADTTRRGYTGHEQIDNILLVHMNGRVFDPNIGRFLSADPYVDCLQNTQGWNRYAYVKGRLLSRYDPSGFMENVIVEGKKIPLEPVSTVSNGRPFAEPSFDGAPNLGAGGGGGAESAPKDNSKDCNETCKQIAAASLAIGTAINMAANLRAGGHVAMIGGAVTGAIIGGAFGYLSANRGETQELANGMALGFATSFPRSPIGGIVASIAGAATEFSLNSNGVPDRFAVPVSGAVSGAVGGAIVAGVSSNSRNVIPMIRAAISGIKPGAGIGAIAGVVTAAVSQILQSQTGCNCGS